METVENVVEKRVLGTHYGLGAIKLWASRISKGIEGDKNPLLPEDIEVIDSVIESVSQIREKYTTAKPKKERKQSTKVSKVLTPEELEAKQAKINEKANKAQERFAKAQERLAKAQAQAAKIAARFSKQTLVPEVSDPIETEASIELVTDSEF